MQEIRNTEIEKTQELVNMAEDYKIASEIRSLINAISQSKIPENNEQWIGWANKKADWFDPTVSANDEILGKREHKKPKEEKKLEVTKVDYYSSWKW